MELNEAILTRRSIRRFTDEPVERKEIEEIIKAAMYAPSAKNLQPWHFVAIDDREILDKITDIHPFAKMTKQSPVALLICGDLDIDPSVGYNAINCAAATQNALLKIHDMGLGAVWLGIYPREERMEGISKLVNLPENIVPISLIALGHTEETKDTPDRFLPDRIHYNGWQK